MADSAVFGGEYTIGPGLESCELLDTLRKGLSVVIGSDEN